MAEKMTEREQFYYGKGYNKAIEEAADLARRPNKMEVVAALFGKKLGEEFKVQKEDVSNPCYAMFTANGLAITDGNGYLLTGMDIDLMGYMVNTEDLLTARAVIVDD